MLGTTAIQFIMQTGNRYSGDPHSCILVVDDSVETLQILEQTLKKGGYLVWTAISGEEALKLISEKGLPHLAIVDLNMEPGMSGFEFCEHLFQFSDLPVIMLTAIDEASTVVKAIQKYAEDYIIKPFSPGELVARVQRILDRVGKFPYRATTPLKVDPHLRVDFPARRLLLGEETASLTPTEARLLYVLMRYSGETVELDYLLRRLWPREMTYEDRLHVYVHRLRNKLSDAGGRHQYVISERGVGYRFQPQGTAAA